MEEETGVKIISPLAEGIFAIQSNPTIGHFKKGKYVPAHTHLDVVFLLEADDSIPLTVQEDENTKVAWIPIDKCIEESKIDFVKPVCKKVIDKMRTLNLL